MISAAALSAAATIPAPPAVTLIRVIRPGTLGNYFTEPYWHIVGDLRHYEFLERWRNGRALTLGDQDDGSWLLDVTDLGLNPADCKAYADAEEERGYLENQEDMYNMHSDPDCQCLCGEIAEQQRIMDKYESQITAAVNERFDAWTRRRHLVALGVAMGLPSCNPGMYDSWVPAPTEAEESAPAAGAASVPTVPAEPYPTWADVAADWDASAFAPVTP